MVAEIMPAFLPIGDTIRPCKARLRVIRDWASFSPTFIHCEYGAPIDEDHPLARLRQGH